MSSESDKGYDSNGYIKTQRCARVCVYVCVCVCERERERESRHKTIILVPPTFQE